MSNSTAESHAVTHADCTSSASSAPSAHSAGTSGLMLAALGVVYGDIGTSPLYALKEAFSQTHHSLPPTQDNVLGVLSLIVWSLLVIVTFKYVMIVLRADNRGEGGVIALMARVVEKLEDGSSRKRTAVLLGLIGASLFYGDGVITPAISVLSAVEGLEVTTPAFQPYVVPITLGILAGLFLVQKHGTARVGGVFGPIVVVWFATLALIGIYNIAAHPQVLEAISPHHAMRFVAHDPFVGFLAMGAVFLTVTGGEALYADMGHFGAKPIRYAWLGLVLPSLLLNYFGQGALIITTPDAIRNPFYLSVPDWGLLPMVVLATAATVIASQALISGAYSITLQLMQLGCSPRMVVKHTSGAQMGQIYVPAVNWLLLGLVMVVVIGFKTSSNLAAAYGIAVTLTMLITTFLAFTNARQDWQWSLPKALLVFGPLIVIEPVFLVSNGMKIADGGWFPLAFGGIVCLFLMTWRRGREIVALAQKNDDVRLEPFVGMLAHEEIPLVPHTAIFLSPRPDYVPAALLHNLKHNMVLHQNTIFLSLIFLPIPRVLESERVQVEKLGEGFHRVKVFFGFMEETNVPEALEWCESQGLRVQAQQASYFLSRDILLPTPGPGGMAHWREVLFEVMFRNATSAANFFNLPANRVVELGSRVII